MLRIVLVMIILTLSGFALNAGQGELSAEEFQQRRVELQSMANRFKQETGFQGRIQIRHDSLTLTHFAGTFPDLTIPPASDTLAVKQVFELILESLMPVLPASKEQLTLESIGGNETRLRVQYRQKVNGHEIEGAGILRISHEYERNITRILNTLMPIDPTPVTPVITEEQARRLFYDNVIPKSIFGEVLSEEEARKTNIVPTPLDEFRGPLYKGDMPFFSLRYSYVREQREDGILWPKVPREYRLSWVANFYSQRFIVDAVTGEILLNITSRRH